MIKRARRDDLRLERMVAGANSLDCARGRGRDLVLGVARRASRLASTLVRTVGGRKRRRQSRRARDAWFREAQTAYLAHDWVSAEQTLLKLLKHDHRDAEARLMLATLLRHEQRTEAAAEQLDRLELLETAAAWRHEIAQERERLRPACVVAEDKIYELPTQEESTNTIADTPDGKIAA